MFNNDNQREARQPQNLQGLLRFALETTRSEDAPNPSNIEQMDPERRQFLEDAIKSMTVDVIKQLENAAKNLTDPNATESDQKESLENILDYVDNMDTANDFCKIGGLNMLVPCLKSPFIAVRSKASSVMAECAQNNPFCQKKLLEMNVLPKLIELLTDSQTSINAIQAISCIVRHYEPCVAAFIDIGGLECILGCLQQIDQEKLLIRSLFLMSSLCTEFPGVRDEFVKLKAVEQVVGLLKPAPEYDVLLDTALGVLNILTENNEAASRCQESDLNLHSTLNEITVLSKGQPECLERIEFCESLTFKLFSLINDTNTDR